MVIGMYMLFVSMYMWFVHGYTCTCGLYMVIGFVMLIYLVLIMLFSYSTLCDHALMITKS